MENRPKAEVAGEPFSWSRLYSLRKEAQRTYRSVFDIPLSKKLLDVVTAELGNSSRLLDVGAADRSLGDKILQRHPDVAYQSMDVDRSRAHDYYTIDGIPGTFDIIVLSEVIEHLTFDEGLSLLGKLFPLLTQGGRLIVSTPNIHHPNRYWWDADHRTPYRYDVLCAALRITGYDIVKIFRTYNDQFMRRFFRLHLALPLHRYLDIDFAKSIVVVAGKK